MNPSDLSNVDLESFLKETPPIFFTCGAILTFVFWGVFWAVFAVIFRRNLAAIPERHRLMRTSSLWWLVVFPVTIVFFFFVVSRISNSWKSFFSELGDTSVGGCGKKAGMASAILGAISNLLNVQAFLGGGLALTGVFQLLATVLGFAGFVALVVYVILINDLKLKSQDSKSGSNPTTGIA
ncbi:MAG: hypothetical protein KDN19_21845 [Verrucomicrobiae bacterium]|nr:hypothetical protein [Verrucomicrobiae bacterium]